MSNYSPKTRMCFVAMPFLFNYDDAYTLFFIRTGHKNLAIKIWPKIKNNVRTIQAGIRNHKVQSLLFLIKLYYFPQTRLYRALKYSRC